MEFNELQSFIDEENARLKKMGKVLCATITNAYDYMVVLVKRSMNLQKDVVAAAASFRIAETKEECQFPTPDEDLNFYYLGPIIVLGILIVLNFILLHRLYSRINNLQAGQVPPG